MLRWACLPLAVQLRLHSHNPTDRSVTHWQPPWLVAEWLLEVAGCQCWTTNLLVTALIVDVCRQVAVSKANCRQVFWGSTVPLFAITSILQQPLPISLGLRYSVVVCPLNLYLLMIADYHRQYPPCYILKIYHNLLSLRATSHSETLQCARLF